MGTVHINAVAVADAVSKLQALQSVCQENSTVPEAKGSGGTACSMSSLEKLYGELFSAFSELLTKTVSTLQSSTSAIQRADLLAARLYETNDMMEL